MTMVRRARWWFHTSTRDRKSTRLNSSHSSISYAVFCLKKKTQITHQFQQSKNTAPTTYNNPLAQSFLPTALHPSTPSLLILPLTRPTLSALYTLHRLHV